MDETTYKCGVVCQSLSLDDILFPFACVRAWRTDLYVCVQRNAKTSSCAVQSVLLVMIMVVGQTKAICVRGILQGVVTS